MKTKIIDRETVIHTVPLEKIDYGKNLTVHFDDINLNRIVKKFIEVISFKVTYEDVWNCDYLCEEAFYTDENGVDRYRRYIYEVLDSKWIDELKKNCDEQDAAVFEDKDFHHYVLMLGDIVLEVISSNIE